MEFQTETDPNRLREIVRAQVIAALERLGVSGALSLKSPNPDANVAQSRHVLLVFMGDEPVSDDFLSHVATLCQEGNRCSAFFSHSFRCFFDPAAILRRLGNAVTQVDTSCEKELLGHVQSAAALVTPGFSRNTAAKMASGIHDSVPSFLISQMILQAKPVFCCTDLAGAGRGFEEKYPSAPPPVVRMNEDALHRLQQMGVRFGKAADLVSEFGAAFRVAVNETPERLARQKPALKREFITADDIWKAVQSGKTVMVHPRNAIITDQARDYAQSTGFVLKAE